MKTENVFINAAKTVAEAPLTAPRACCGAISDYDSRDRFRSVFTPTDTEIKKYSQGDKTFWYGRFSKRNKEARVLALLFAHEMGL